MKIFYFCFFLLRSFTLFGQDGSVLDPFTSLGLALTVPSAGVYYFNIGGTTFNTYVDGGGYVMVAIDFGNGSGNLPQTTSLNTGARGILTPAVLSSLSTLTEVRISSSGSTNVSTTNSVIRSKLVGNQTLHGGVGDNASNNFWTGSNAAAFTGDASCNSLAGSALQQNVFHPCGNGSGFHWMPTGGYQLEIWSSIDVPSSGYLRLWVRDNSSPLPIELIYFKGKLEKNVVKLDWKTSSEINNDFFTIERSTNEMEWLEISKVKGAGNSFQILDYSYLDKNLENDLYYYRLKQTDFDGKYKYSKTISVNNTEMLDNQLIGFPNPCSEKLIIQANFSETEAICIFDYLGKEVTNFVEFTKLSNNSYSVLVETLPPGIYVLRSSIYFFKFIKE